MNVFDFDNTIYDGESSVDFFFYFLKKDPSLSKHVPELLLALAKYKSGKLSIEEALNKYGKKLSAYFKENLSGKNTLSFEAENFWRTHIKNINPFYDEVKSPDDIIISCSPEFLLQRPVEILGVKNCICSKIDEKSGEITCLCFRENKAKAFLKEYPDGVIDNFYTDSFNDKPLMDLSRSVFLVKHGKTEKIK